MKRILVGIATFFYIGCIKVAPGTMGSLATMLAAFYIQPFRDAPLVVKLMVIALVFIIGTPAARASETHFNKKDPGQCVIDEVLGQLIALLWVPPVIWYYLISFGLFRFFDIFKPFPVRNLEKIPHGLGIMLDDVAAGLYALGVFHLAFGLIHAV